MNDQEQLQQLLNAKHHCITIVTHEEDYALRLVRDSAINAGMADVQLWSVIGGVRDGLVSDVAGVPETEHPAAGLYALLHRDIGEGSYTVTLDLAPHLKDDRVLRLLRDLLRAYRQAGAHLVMIDYHTDLPPVIASEAVPLEISLPDEDELVEIIRRTLRRVNREDKVEVAISRSGLQTIIRNLHGLTRRQAEQIIIEVITDDHRFDDDDINRVLAAKRRALHQDGLLEYIQVPVSQDEIGGLKRLKLWLAQRASAFTGQASKFGLNAPRGVLMLGVQGAGKSLCAKAIATAWQRPLLRMDVGALYDRYIGESEKRLRDSLVQAERMAPIVLWIDEIEKAFASSASRSTDGGLSQRMFGSLLTWMQEHTAPVFLVATANDIEALPPELLRKGRFDEIFFVDLPGSEARQQIAAIHIAKRGRDPQKFDLAAIAAAAEGYSGAEIEQAIISALHDAFTARQDLTSERIIEALRNSPPLSVTMAESVQSLRAWARNRCVPAD